MWKPCGYALDPLIFSYSKSQTVQYSESEDYLNFKSVQNPETEELQSNNSNISVTVLNSI